jgi:hypothetical protein
VTRDDAIKEGLIKPMENDQVRHECIRKVRYRTLADAFPEAARLAARDQKAGKRINIYVCRFGVHFHIGNYTPCKRTLPGLLVAAQEHNEKLLGDLKKVKNELEQCRTSRQRLKTELGRIEHQKSLFGRLRAWLSQ